MPLIFSLAWFNNVRSSVRPSVFWVIKLLALLIKANALFIWVSIRAMLVLRVAVKLVMVLSRAVMWKFIWVEFQKIVESLNYFLIHGWSIVSQKNLKSVLLCDFTFIVHRTDGVVVVRSVVRFGLNLNFLCCGQFCSYNSFVKNFARWLQIFRVDSIKHQILWFKLFPCPLHINTIGINCFLKLVFTNRAWVFAENFLCQKQFHKVKRTFPFHWYFHRLYYFQLFSIPTLLHLKCGLTIYIKHAKATKEAENRKTSTTSFRISLLFFITLFYFFTKLFIISFIVFEMCIFWVVA